MAPSLPPAKKRKTGPSSADSVLQTVAVIEASVTAALAENTSLNPLADLLHIASTNSDADVVLKAIFALYRLFTLIAQKGILSASIDDEEPGRKVVRSWVAAHLDAFVELLCALLTDEEKILRISSLRILFSLLRQLSSTIGRSSEASSSSTAPLQFDVPFFKKIVQALLLCPASVRAKGAQKGQKARRSVDSGGELDPDVCNLFLETWLNVYIDIRWFFLRETATLLENSTLIAAHPFLLVNALSVLEKLTGFPFADPNSSDLLQKSFWIEELNAKPKARKKEARTADTSEDEEGNEGESDEGGEADDWRKFFDDPKPNQKASKMKNEKAPGRRLHTMSVHEQLHAHFAHRAVFTRCWLALLPLLSGGGSVFLHTRSDDDDDDEEVQAHLVLVTRALTVLHRGVLPHLTRALLIMDWVAGCVDYGGNVGLLALNALFVLMQEYNLDYPQFYTRLYAFLDRNVLHLRHRARFFRLTELFLSSSHLPATLLASFVKRLARLSLSAPPAAVIMVIPFTYNILKRHPALMVMIHRDDDGDSEVDDPFDATEPNPTLTGALQSSLWELTSHRRHYHSAVATLARVFEEAFTRPGYAMEDFLDHTYATLFETEANRKVKKEPAVIELELEHAQPMLVRTKGSRAHDREDINAEAAEMQSDIVSAMWVFG